MSNASNTELTGADVRRFAALAMFCDDDKDMPWIELRAGELAEKLAIIDGVNVDGAEPMVSPLDVKNVFRDDVDMKTISRDKLLSNAPDKQNGFFTVPKTFG